MFEEIKLAMFFIVAIAFYAYGLWTLEVMEENKRINQEVEERENNND